MIPSMFRPPQTNSRGFLKSFNDALKLAGTGEHTMTWNRFQDHVVVTIGGWVLTTDHTGLEKLKMAAKNGKAKRRRNRHDSLGILHRFKKRIMP